MQVRESTRVFKCFEFRSCFLSAMCEFFCKKIHLVIRYLLRFHLASTPRIEIKISSRKTGNEQSEMRTVRCCNFFLRVAQCRQNLKMLVSVQESGLFECNVYLLPLHQRHSSDFRKKVMSGPFSDLKRNYPQHVSCKQC